jgi:hypothetical protein
LRSGGAASVGDSMLRLYNGPLVIRSRSSSGTFKVSLGGAGAGDGGTTRGAELVLDDSSSADDDELR